MGANGGPRATRRASRHSLARLLRAGAWQPTHGARRASAAPAKDAAPPRREPTRGNQTRKAPYAAAAKRARAAHPQRPILRAFRHEPSNVPKSGPCVLRAPPNFSRHWTRSESNSLEHGCESAARRVGARAAADPADACRCEAAERAARSIAPNAEVDWARPRARAGLLGLFLGLGFLLEAIAFDASEKASLPEFAVFYAGRTVAIPRWKLVIQVTMLIGGMFNFPRFFLAALRTPLPAVRRAADLVALPVFIGNVFYNVMHVARLETLFGSLDVAALRKQGSLAEWPAARFEAARAELAQAHVVALAFLLALFVVQLAAFSASQPKGKRN